jgi:hypothetical protein
MLHVTNPTPGSECNPTAFRGDVALHHGVVLVAVLVRPAAAAAAAADELAIGDPEEEDGCEPPLFCDGECGRGEAGEVADDESAGHAAAALTPAAALGVVVVQQRAAPFEVERAILLWWRACVWKGQRM